MGIDDIEMGCQYPDELFTDTMESQPHSQDYPAASTPRRIGRPTHEAQESPIRMNPETQQEIRILPSAMNTPPWLRLPKEQNWKERPPFDLKFIDDGVNVTSVNMKKVSMYVNQHGKNIKCIHPVKAQAMMNHITTRAAEKGMVVNGSKTTLMCINAASSKKQVPN